MDCRAKHFLYLRANGDIPCYCDQGEEIVLARLDVDDPAPWCVVDPVLEGPPFLDLRRSLLEGKAPFPDTCPRCAFFLPDAPYSAPRRGLAARLDKLARRVGHPSLVEPLRRMNRHPFAARIRSSWRARHQNPAVGQERCPPVLDCLHIEPSFLCHLRCECCGPDHPRTSSRPGPHLLTASRFGEVLADLEAHQITVRHVTFEGRGEPLHHPDLPSMIREAKSRLGAQTQVVTNGNASLESELVRSGLDKLVVSVDGATSDSYLRYRRGGDFDRALTFMTSVVSTRKHPARPYVVWKYILFEWNDSDQEIRQAAQLAGEIGVNELCFARTGCPDPGYSTRYRTDHDIASRFPVRSSRITHTRTEALVRQGLEACGTAGRN